MHSITDDIFLSTSLTQWQYVHLTADSLLHGDELCGVFLLQDDAVLVVSARVGDVNLQAVRHRVH